VGATCERATWLHQGGIASAAELVVKNSGKPKDLSNMLRPTGYVKSENITVLGTLRTAEIVVNIILRAVFAMVTHPNDRRPEDTQLRNLALSHYSSHPKLAANSVNKEAVIALFSEMFRHGIRDRQPRLPGV
jgi:hypothetical protein